MSWTGGGFGLLLPVLLSKTSSEKMWWGSKGGGSKLASVNNRIGSDHAGDQCGKVQPGPTDPWQTSSSRSGVGWWRKSRGGDRGQEED
eukprot:748301-Hanusia_phi.AAC.2